MMTLLMSVTALPKWDLTLLYVQPAGRTLSAYSGCSTYSTGQTCTVDNGDGENLALTVIMYMDCMVIKERPMEEMASTFNLSRKI